MLQERSPTEDHHLHQPPAVAGGFVVLPRKETTVPTYETLPRFAADLQHLTPAQRRRFRRAVTVFVDDLRTRQHFRASLRIKRVHGAPGVFELTWDGNGRATWSYGPEIRPGKQHIIWRRIGSHAILAGP
ncbi:hypothetical protein AB0M57_11250 [Streptomyces sp. NPDC051597]|uniref:hypothetical protein n=1 Tax=Streptomyces sp. NPDC051597 TaxID=3155049 RepID=UPI003444EBE8